MKSDPRSFQRTCSILYVLLFLGTAAAFAGSLIFDPVKMRGFPLVFFLAALANFLTARIRFRPDRDRRNQKGAGLVSVLVGIFFLVCCLISLISVW